MPFLETTANSASIGRKMSSVAPLFRKLWPTEVWSYFGKKWCSLSTSLHSSHSEVDLEGLYGASAQLKATEHQLTAPGPRDLLREMPAAEC